MCHEIFAGVYFCGMVKLKPVEVRSHLYSTAFPQFTIHLILCSFHGLMNSINWPAWHCMGLHSTDVRALQRERREATGSNPNEALKSFFSG